MRMGFIGRQSIGILPVNHLPYALVLPQGSLLGSCWCLYFTSIMVLKSHDLAMAFNTKASSFTIQLKRQQDLAFFIRQ